MNNRSMNDPGIRMALGLGIVAGGFFVANLFTPHPDAPPSPELQNSLRIRAQRNLIKQIPLQTALSETGSGKMPSPASLKVSGTPPPVVLRAQDTPVLPTIPPKHPGDAMPGRATWGMPAVDTTPSLPPVRPRTHRIVDGDTLRGLAALYLNSPDRADEIFAANRAVLQDPALLPIGTEIVIPSREPPSPAEDQYVPSRRLVPVPASWMSK
jgi:hypothetical protein